MTEPHQTHMADAFVSLLITVPQSVCVSGGPERLYLSTRSCETFDCSCMETDILVTEPEGPRRAALRFEPSTRSMEVISNADGLLSAAGCEWIAERLSGDTGAFIEARAKRAKTRGLKAPWRLRSWTDYRPGELIPFHEAVPGEPDLVANVDGIQYWARDLYCVAKHCDCYEAVLDMFPDVQARDTPEGFVRIDLHGGEVTSSDHPALPDIYRAIRTTYGIDELRSRYARMRKMAKDPTVQLGAEPSAPVNSAPKPIKVGRNDPCPCGSGKKWKKCCG